ncbi:MAG: hypothetical protein RXN79_00195 [Candidatus Nanopusillus sp.]
MNKKAGLIIRGGIKLPEHIIYYLFLGTIISLWAIYNPTIYVPINYAIYATLFGFQIRKYDKSIAYYSPFLRSIYIKKNNIKEKTNYIINKIYSNNIEIKEDSIIAINFFIDNIVYYPVYIDKDKNNIEEIISRPLIKSALAHEKSHQIVGISEIKASALGFLVYFDMYNLYKYEKAKEVVRRNIKRCMEYVESNNRYNPYTIGECYGNIVLYENNFSINIIEEIKKLKHMKNKNIIEKVKNYTLNYSNENILKYSLN